MKPSVVLEAKHVDLATDSNYEIVETALKSISLWRNGKVVVFLVIMLSLAVFQALIFFVYTYISGIGFTKTNRQYVWCFLCISIMYIARVSYFVFLGKKMQRTGH